MYYESMVGKLQLDCSGNLEEVETGASNPGIRETAPAHTGAVLMRSI